MMKMTMTTIMIKNINFCSIKCDLSLEPQDQGNFESDDDNDDDGDDDENDNNNNDKTNKSL